jgi:hypothetical protein
MNESELKKILNLSTKSDPFILLPTMDHELEIKSNVLQRVLNAENVLIKEI